MWLAVDAGNSLVKWALLGDGRPLQVETAQHGQWHALKKAALLADNIWVSNVGSVDCAHQLRQALAVCSKVRFITAPAQGGDVINHYRPPSSLGSDRWLGLVAVRVRRRHSIIISTGTATTIDALSATGVFLGGVVLPGIMAMRQTLAATTSLQLLPENVSWPPLQTSAAVANGTLLATAGAALMLRRRLLPGAEIILTGGNAPALRPWLPQTTVSIPHLPIMGMMRLREEG